MLTSVRCLLATIIFLDRQRIRANSLCSLRMRCFARITSSSRLEFSYLTLFMILVSINVNREVGDD
jgi:hypothetical protein